MIKQKKYPWICWYKRKRQNKKKKTVQLEEINKKVLSKEGRLRRYRQRVKNTDKAGHSKTTKEDSTNNWEEMTRKPTNNRMQKKANDFGLKNGNQKNIMEKPCGLTA